MSLPLSPRSDHFAVNLPLIEEISRSILSNLDRDSLLNSIISLLHQFFEFSKVTIYTSRGEDKASFKTIGISQDGLIPEMIWHNDQDRGPVGWCIAHLEPLVINELAIEQRFPSHAFDKNVESALFVPLRQGNLFIGVLELCAEVTNAFPPEIVQIFSALADKIAIAIRNANLYFAEQVRGLITERLQNLVGSLDADESLDGLCSTLLDELQEFFPCEVSAIWLIKAFEDETGAGQFTTSFQLAGIKLSDPENRDLFEPYIQNIADSSELINNYPWISDVLNVKIPAFRGSESPFEPLGGLLNFEKTYSALAIPLVLHDEPNGVIVCAHHLPDQYDSEHLAIAHTYGKFSAVSIENARLYQVAHDQAWISTVLLQVAESTQSITNLDDLLETIASILPGLIGAEACALFLWEPSADSFTGSASNGFSDEQAARLKAWNIPPGSALAFEDLKEKRSPIILNKTSISQEIASVVFPEFDLDENLLILFPLLTQNFLCGALLVDFSNSDLNFNSSQDAWDDKYTLIQGAARQAAIAIENLLLIKSQEEEAYISVALLQVAQAVVSLNQLDEILATIVRITPILVGVKRCIIYIWDGKDQVFRISQYFGFSKNDLASMGLVIKANEFSFIETIKLQNKIAYCNLTAESSPGDWSELSASDYHVIEGLVTDSDEVAIHLDDQLFATRDRLLIGFPLSVKTDNVGVMLIEEEEPMRGLTSTHIREKRIEIVKGITQQAAIAIKNEQLQQEAVKSERMERELQLAREIQAAFLPEKLPELPGWDVDVRWQPAREVGGDFYDFIILDENRVGFVIADVADKGMPAALFMTLIRTLIRAAAKEKSSPAAVLKQVNELLIPDAKQGIFVTVFYGVISLDSGAFVYANAGHNPPLIKSGITGDLVELTRTTIALGIFNDIEVQERETIINRGDWLLLYTDGITEAFSPQDVMFTIERLTTLYSGDDFHSSKELVQLITGSVAVFIQGADLSDDITVVAFHRED